MQSTLRIKFKQQRGHHLANWQTQILRCRPQRTYAFHVVTHMMYLCREEGEKFNIWQAWLNLENMYGSPTPDEAITRLFQKALPYCNAKKLYLALLDILERTNKVSCSLACAIALQLRLILGCEQAQTAQELSSVFLILRCCCGCCCCEAEKSFFCDGKASKMS